MCFLIVSLHRITEDEVDKRNIRLSSEITVIRAYMNDLGYTRILSFQKQLYIHPNHVTNLPQDSRNIADKLNAVNISRECQCLRSAYSSSRNAGNVLLSNNNTFPR